MDAALVYSPAMAGYDLGPEHPLRPERFTLAVSLMEACGIVPPGTADGAPDGEAALTVVAPAPASDGDLALVHDPDYIAAVRATATLEGALTGAVFGLGTMDTPVFPRMHEASALIAGGTLQAVADVGGGRSRRAFAVAGGLHHAHRDRAAGFCVYNDAAVAVAAALRDRPDLRVAYVDIDAHHGDGVQEAFYRDPRVLTISLHETGEALFPGTGFTRERGSGPGTGFAVNVPLPPLATDACYALAFEQVVAPRTRAFAPDVVVAQCGADALHDDPLTTMGLTLAGHAALVRGIVALADELCGGRLVALGGGGYAWEHQVPRAWTRVAAELAGSGLPAELPDRWRELARRVSGVEPPRLLADDDFAVDPDREARLLERTRSVVRELAG